MKTVTSTEATNQLDAILYAAQREPIVIRRQDRDIAVVLSMADYDRLRSANARAFIDLRNEVATEATRGGLTDDRIVSALNGRREAATRPTAAHSQDFLYGDDGPPR